MPTPDLEVLLAERAIERQLIHFARAMDDRAWSTILGILADDATADFGTGPLAGGPTIVAHIRRYLDACGPTQHLLGNVLVDVDLAQGVATSRAYVHDEHLAADSSPDLLFWTHGDYHDRWVRIDGAWRLCHREKRSRAHRGSMAVFGLPNR